MKDEKAPTTGFDVLKIFIISSCISITILLSVILITSTFDEKAQHEAENKLMCLKGYTFYPYEPDKTLIQMKNEQGTGVPCSPETVNKY